MNDVMKKKIGLIGAMAIVAGNMMGSGISLLPTSLAAIGSITIISWLITLLGALSLAFVFARLGIIDPEEGGPVIYAGKVAPILGFQTGILYWLANWIGNLAIAITGVEYLSVFYKPLTEPIIGGLTTILCVWIFTILNYFGTDKIAKIVSVTVILLLIPVIGTALFGWVHFSPQTFVNNWNVSNTSAIRAIFAGILLAIWSFIGVESASVNAALVKKPSRTIPLATMGGTTLAAIAYIASTTVISGMFPAGETAKAGAPFAQSFSLIVGSWAKPYVSAFTAIACLASLGSWMMLVGQAGIAAAKKNTLPAIFARKSKKRGIPIAGITINSLLMTGLMVILMTISKIVHQPATAIFGYVISIAVLLTILPYFYSCLQLIKVEGFHKKTILKFTAGVLAAIFCFFAFIGAKNTDLIGVVIVSLLCFFFYVLKFNKQKAPKE